MNDYKIWITYNEDGIVEKYGLKEDDNHSLFAVHREVDGENINRLHQVYSDVATMWYVWKNNKKSNFVGFNNYRRIFDVSRLPQKGECQVYDIKDFGVQTIYGQYATCHDAKDMNIVLSILDGKYGEGNSYTKNIRDGHNLVSGCGFLMKWTDFTKMCRFMFPILEEFKTTVFPSAQEVSYEMWADRAVKTFGGNRPDYQARAVSFIAERLISAWITVNLSPYINGRNVAVAHYNTPELLEAAILSVKKHTPGCHFYVFDNSDRRPFAKRMDNVEIIDNTRQQLVNFDEELEKHPDKWAGDVEKSNYGSMKHTMSVDKLLELVPDGFVLIDSDILITNDISIFWNKSFACAGSEYVKKGVPQLQPFLCYLNVPMLRERGIRYYNGDKMWALSRKNPNQFYETGAWLLEEVRRHKLPVSYVNIWRYVVHYGHGSWRGKASAEWLKENKALYSNE